jgi:putative membrane protein
MSDKLLMIFMMSALIISSSLSIAATTAKPIPAVNAMIEPVEFINVAAQSDEFQRQAGQIAIDRATSPDVRQLAQDLVNEHTKSTQSLTEAAQKGGQTPPPSSVSLSEEQKMMLDKLRKADSKEFDALYLLQQAKVHHNALGLMQGYAANGSNSSLKQTATNSAPVIQQHLDRIHRIQRGLSMDVASLK